MMTSSARIQQKEMILFCFWHVYHEFFSIFVNTVNVLDTD